MRDDKRMRHLTLTSDEITCTSSAASRAQELLERAALARGALYSDTACLRPPVVNEARPEVASAVLRGGTACKLQERRLLDLLLLPARDLLVQGLSNVGDE